MLFTPTAQAIWATQLSRFCQHLEATRGLRFGGTPSERYGALHAWSVTELAEFWAAVAEFFDIAWRKPPALVLDHPEMPGAAWFVGGELNYAEHALRAAHGVAVVSLSEAGERREVSYAELRVLVARCRASLKHLGVGLGDRVAAYLPNALEAVVAFMATASLGAIWSSCPPEFGVASVLDRFRQIEPKVLIAVDGYRYGGKWFDRRAEVEQIHQQLPGVVSLIRLGEGGQVD
ncbi:MAG: hypothetical protein RJA70_4042, partial [Pseudomonadota bacterium]